MGQKYWKAFASRIFFNSFLGKYLCVILYNKLLLMLKKPTHFQYHYNMSMYMLKSKDQKHIFSIKICKDYFFLLFFELRHSFVEFMN